MSPEHVFEEAEIEFRFDQKYREQVMQAEPDSWIEIAISVGDTYIYGDAEAGVTGFACGAVLNFLDSVEAILDDSQYIVEFEFGPTWIALYPRDDDSIEVAKRITLNRAQERADLHEGEIARPVTKEAWVAAVLDAARTFHGTVVDLNPALEDHAVLRQIRTEIERVEQLHEQMGE